MKATDEKNMYLIKGFMTVAAFSFMKWEKSETAVEKEVWTGFVKASLDSARKVIVKLEDEDLKIDLGVKLKDLEKLVVITLETFK